jgi:hypothetical protein
MRTTVRLPDDLLENARERAAEQGRTLTSLIEEGLNRVLSEPQAATRSPIRLPVSMSGGGTLPGVDLNRSTDLLDLMEQQGDHS